MRKVVTISLHGKACQVDEAGHRALSDYLADATAKLAGNPDRAEILADLEQAIAERCQACLHAHKDVVSEEEVERILREMGPVEIQDDSEARPAADARPDGPDGAAPRRRLFRLKEGSKFGGVCNGLAAYTGVDVTWIRLAFLLLTFSTGVFFFIWLGMLVIIPVARTDEDLALARAGSIPGSSRPLRRIPADGMLGGVCAGLAAWAGIDVAWIRLAFLVATFVTGGMFGLLWLAMLVLMPAAHTPEEIAAVRGAPFNARDILDRTRRQFRRDEAATARSDAGQGTPGRTARVAAFALMPVLTLLSAALFVAFLTALGVLALHLNGGVPWEYSPDGHGMLWQLHLGPGHGIPFVALLVAYLLVAAPVGMARRAARRQAGDWGSLTTSLDRLLWIGIVLVLSWLLSKQIPWIIDHLWNFTKTYTV